MLVVNYTKILGLRILEAVQQIDSLHALTDVYEVEKDKVWRPSCRELLAACGVGQDTELG